MDLDVSLLGADKGSHSLIKYPLRLRTCIAGNLPRLCVKRTVHLDKPGYSACSGISVRVDSWRAYPKLHLDWLCVDIKEKLWSAINDFVLSLCWDDLKLGCDKLLIKGTSGKVDAWKNGKVLQLFPWQIQLLFAVHILLSSLPLTEALKQSDLNCADHSCAKTDAV